MIICEETFASLLLFANHKIGIETILFSNVYIMFLQATASVPPQLWQPSSGILMTNDVNDNNTEDAVPCFALSKNDSYVMSASGGKISLFNMMTFKVSCWPKSLFECVFVL